jgi:L-ascorbate metabolism protein UlaG (beta-lactamase superfamily)
MKRRKWMMTGYVVLCIVLILFTIRGAKTIQAKEKMNTYNNNKDSVLIEKGRFLNQEPTKTMLGMSKSTLKQMLRKGEKVPEVPLPIYSFNKTPYAKSNDSILAVVWLGHSCALIELDGKLILTDPMLSKRAGPTSWTGTKRFHGEVPVEVEMLPELDVVLISHDHFDHLDKQTIKALDAKTKQYIVPLGIAQYLKKWGIDAKKIEQRSWWESIKIGGTEFISTPARHFSGRGLFDRNTTLWTSWVIIGKHQRVFFSGDSGYQEAFKTIGKKYGPFDLSLLECGQYNEDWGLIHMSPEESVQAGIDLGSKYALPIHWGAFSLSVHAWYEPVERFKAKANAEGLNMITPQIGERLVIDKNSQTSNWWESLNKALD